ncbi:hypothetical protein [Mesorhizobium sp. M8A.F.Ca.ET.021.01.1.1]|uniref:hypothetical protein n=1 Tax=Mesorhizobium sp. M8A.F.Ca.ET.021.01.1.1 TaxID=2496757 RepID=UPI000FCA2993|nr:hypothetical protein [Mesorhizobium sp. M8A.F.Ca.ET.021.01.1.1]RUW56814.1 hypothetical protein EOA36_02115 [Mesorhizobium sp. M8A.F.Ca.ET.021.01.1.1]
MKNVLLATLFATVAATALLFLAGCDPETPEQASRRIEQTSTEGTEIVAVVDGCRLFRVNDPRNPHYVYFAHCAGGSDQADTSYETGGKTSHTVRVTTTGE